MKFNQTKFDNHIDNFSYAFVRNQQTWTYMIPTNEKVVKVSLVPAPDKEDTFKAIRVSCENGSFTKAIRSALTEVAALATYGPSTIFINNGAKVVSNDLMQKIYECMDIDDEERIIEYV